MEAMKIIGLVLLSVASLVCFGFLRENLILQEVQHTQIQILQDLRRDFQKIESLDDLNRELQASKVHQDYLLPVQQQIQALVWPPLRKRALENWNQSLHKSIKSERQIRETQILSVIQEGLGHIRETEVASQDRMLKVLEKSLLLNDNDRALKELQEELRLLEAQLKESDRARLQDIRKIGIDSLRGLRSRLQAQTTEEETLSYLSSRAFYSEVIESVSDEILSLNQEEARKLTWNEFSMQLLRLLNRQNQVMAQRRLQEEERQERNVLAEILRERYLRELERDQLASDEVWDLSTQ
ncbi:MAG: hypothetical protein EA369_08825 [Bradymonadales bacterium]|nr:MAG: hypothetical protein EA369_08825 [Bradymonadales bacterium]